MNEYFWKQTPEMRSDHVKVSYADLNKWFLPNIYTHTWSCQSMYSDVNPLVYVQGQETVMLESQEGIYQGVPLGVALFSITFHPFLTEVQFRHNTVKFLAYLDSHCRRCKKSCLVWNISGLRCKIGHENEDRKCEISCHPLGHRPSLPSSNVIPPASSIGSRVLGTPGGCDTLVTESRLKLMNWVSLCVTHCLLYKIRKALCCFCQDSVVSHIWTTSQEQSLHGCFSQQEHFMIHWS